MRFGENLALKICETLRLDNSKYKFLEELISNDIDKNNHKHFKI